MASQKQQYTILYGRLSQEDERAGESNSIQHHDTISERTDCRGASCKTGNRICRADSKLDSICFAIKQKSHLHNRSGRRLAAAFFYILQKNRISALFYK